jgi:hypothetical protein
MPVDDAAILEQLVRADLERMFSYDFGAWLQALLEMW